MRALLIILTFLATAAAQSFDPDEYIDKKDLRNADVNQLWQTLGISATIRETTASGAKDTSKTFDCSSDDRCEAQRVGFRRWSLTDNGGGDSGDSPL